MEVPSAWEPRAGNGERMWSGRDPGSRDARGRPGWGSAWWVHPAGGRRVVCSSTAQAVKPCKTCNLEHTERDAPGQRRERPGAMFPGPGPGRVGRPPGGAERRTAGERDPGASRSAAPHAAAGQIEWSSIAGRTRRGPGCSRASAPRAGSRARSGRACGQLRRAAVSPPNGVISGTHGAAAPARLRWRERTPPRDDLHLRSRSARTRISRWRRPRRSRTG